MDFASNSYFLSTVCMCICSLLTWFCYKKILAVLFKLSASKQLEQLNLVYDLKENHLH